MKLLSCCETYVRRTFNRLIPNEGSKLAEVLRAVCWLLLPMKVVGVLGGVVVVIKAFYTLRQGLPEIPPVLLKGAGSFLGAFSRLFVELFLLSLPYLWQPVALYLLIALFLKHFLWRKFWCLVGVAWFLLLFITGLQHAGWKEYRMLPLLMVQGYLFLLWLMPREIWNIIGLTISGIVGFIILVLPDLPTAFDDFGMFGAVLAFFLGYLNLLASLLQRAADRL